MKEATEDAINTATATELAEFLSSSERDFTDSLRTRIEIDSYAQKIFCYAVRFETWDDATLVGMVALYCNDTIHRKAFITSVSVRAGWERRGIAGRLLTQSVEYAATCGMKEIQLEVATRNSAAVRLYRKHGFIEMHATPLLMTMQLRLNTITVP
jgi:ribosomal protein S18 acetylase RimI-like enzyme